jgi:hypothetical protein
VLEQLKHLLAVGAPARIGREGGRLVGRAHREDHLGDVGAAHRLVDDVGGALPQVALEASLELTPQPQHRGVPLHLRVNVVEPGVVQLVQRPQRQLCVVVTQHVHV